MISIKDTDVLISKIQQINDLLVTFGVTDIAIYRPTSHREAKKLNFVGKIKEPETKDLFYIFHIEDELSKLLGYKVRFTSEDAINDNFQELIHTNKCIIKTNEADKIRDFIAAPWLFNKHIVNTQKNFINDPQEERKYNSATDYEKCEKSTKFWNIYNLIRSFGKF